MLDHVTAPLDIGLFVDAKLIELVDRIFSSPGHALAPNDTAHVRSSARMRTMHPKYSRVWVVLNED